MTLQYFMNRIFYSAAIFLYFSVLLFISTLAFSQEDTSVDLEREKEQEIKEFRKNDDSEKPDKNKIFGFDIGLGGNYSSGVSVSNFYYKPYGNFYLKHKYVKFTTGIYRYQNYLITNGEGKFETVNFTQPKISLSLYPHKVIELYGEYRFSTGDPSHYYRGHDGTAGFLLNFDVVTIDAMFNKRLIEYRFKSIDWQNKITLLYSDISNHGHVTQYYTINLSNIKYINDVSATVDLSWYVINTTSIDASYYYLNSIFKEPKDSYYVHTGRVGVYSDIWKYISLHGGVSLGIDGEKYIIAGGDFGVTFDILGYVTISATYLPSYYIASRTNSALDKFVELYALYVFDYNAISTANPNLQPSLIGKSFLNHSLNFSVSYKY